MKRKSIVLAVATLIAGFTICQQPADARLFGKKKANKQTEAKAHEKTK